VRHRSVRVVEAAIESCFVTPVNTETHQNTSP